MRPSLVQNPREFQTPVAGVPTTPTGYHQWHRSLAVELGRFVGRDPIPYRADELSLSSYVGSNPIRHLDPNGDQFVPVPPRRPAGYGRYCGPTRRAVCNADGTPVPPRRGGPNEPPRDALDEACMRHDCCLMRRPTVFETIWRICLDFSPCNDELCFAARNFDCWAAYPNADDETYDCVRGRQMVLDACGFFGS
jgi:RHS repeat-associated protein